MEKYTELFVTSSIKRMMSLRELESRNAEDPSQYKEEFDAFLARESKHWIKEYSTMKPLSIILENLADVNERKNALKELEGLINE